MFYAYLREAGGEQTVGTVDPTLWLRYFRRHSTFRTLCQDCGDQIDEGYRMERKRVRRQEKIALRLEREKAEMAAMSETEKNRWLAHVFRRSERSREMIRWWVARARLQALDRRRAEI